MRIVLAIWPHQKGAYPALGAGAARDLLGKASAEGDLARTKAAVGGGADVAFSGYHDETGATTGAYLDSTAVHVAARNGHPGLVRFLVVGAGAAADARNTNKNRGYTPCLWAINNNKPRAVRALVEAGADPNRVGATDGGWEGRTPCMLAATWGHTACLRALGTAPTLDVNAVAAAGSYKRRTALDVALRTNEAKAAAFLRDELGAKRAADLTADDQQKSRDIARGAATAKPAAAAAPALAAAPGPAATPPAPAAESSSAAISSTTNSSPPPPFSAAVFVGDVCSSGVAAARHTADMATAKGPRTPADENV